LIQQIYAQAYYLMFLLHATRRNQYSKNLHVTGIVKIIYASLRYQWW